MIKTSARLMLLVGLFVPSGTSHAEDGPAGRPPNVLLLLSDDQRPDTIHALGNRVIRTPHLDRLVEAGTTFTRALSPSPVCVTSRAEILSGCSVFRNGVNPPFRNQLDPKLVLWPEAMRRAGYRTWYVGKWHTEGRPTTRATTRASACSPPAAPPTPRGSTSGATPSPATSAGSSSPTTAGSSRGEGSA